MSIIYLREIETARANPTLHQLEVLAETYGADVESLFADAGPWQAPRAGRPASSPPPSRRSSRSGRTKATAKPSAKPSRRQVAVKVGKIMPDETTLSAAEPPATYPRRTTGRQSTRAPKGR